MKTQIVIVASLLLAGSLTAQHVKYVIKSTHLSESAIGVSCLNGGDPTGRMVGDVLVISCGATSPEAVPMAQFDQEKKEWFCPAGYSTFASENELAAGKKNYVHCVK